MGHADAFGKGNRRCEENKPWRGRATSSLPPQGAATGSPAKAYSELSTEALALPTSYAPDWRPRAYDHAQGFAMRVVEKITGTAGRYVLTGTVSRDERGRYFAHASTYLLTPGPMDRALRSVATAQANGPEIEAIGATAPEARTRLCVAARERLAATVTSFVWRPVVVLVAGQWGRVNRENGP